MTLSGILNDEFTTITQEPSSIVYINAAADYHPIQWCFSLALLKRAAYKPIIPLGVFWLAQKYGFSVDFFSKKYQIPFYNDDISIVWKWMAWELQWMPWLLTWH